jgi:group I intron endonuclease
MAANEKFNFSDYDAIDLEHISGIYKILNLKNGKFYVGSSVKLRKRFFDHRSSLLKQNHDNSKLQNSFNKHGINNFEFIILESKIEREKLIEREQFYIDKLNPQYNISKIADRPTYGTVKSKEWKKNHSIFMKKLNKSENYINPMKNKIVSNETKNKIRKLLIGNYNDSARNVKLNWEIVKNIRNDFINFNFSVKDLAKKYNVCKLTILNVLNNQRWKIDDQNLNAAIKSILLKNKLKNLKYYKNTETL